MNLTKKFSQLVAVVALLVATGAAYAQIQPAMLADPAIEKAFINLIEFPETHGDAKVRLDCYGMIKKNGKIQTGCYVKNNWEPDFANAVVMAAKKGLWQPATDGKKDVAVVVHFQVLFEKTGDDRRKKIIMNSALPDNVEEYGEDHVAAQRVYGYEPWQKACPKRAEWYIYARAHVNDQGQASSVDLEHVRGIVPTAPCLNAIVQTLEQSQFAPLIIDGVAVPSSYEEAFGN